MESLQWEETPAILLQRTCRRLWLAPIQTPGGNPSRSLFYHTRSFGVPQGLTPVSYNREYWLE